MGAPVMRERAAVLERSSLDDGHGDLTSRPPEEPLLHMIEEVRARGRMPVDRAHLSMPCRGGVLGSGTVPGSESHWKLER